MYDKIHYKLKKKKKSMWSLQKTWKMEKNQKSFMIPSVNYMYVLVHSLGFSYVCSVMFDFLPLHGP